MKGISREGIIFIIFLILLTFILILMLIIFKEQTKPFTESLKEIFKNLLKMW